MIRKVERIAALRRCFGGRHSASASVCQFADTKEERHFLVAAVTRGNKCSGRIGSAEENVDTLAESVSYVANPVSDAKVVDKITYYRLHITTPTRKFTNIHH